MRGCVSAVLLLSLISRLSRRRSRAGLRQTGVLQHPIRQGRSGPARQARAVHGYPELHRHDAARQCVGRRPGAAGTGQGGEERPGGRCARSRRSVALRLAGKRPPASRMDGENIVAQRSGGRRPSWLRRPGDVAGTRHLEESQSEGHDVGRAGPGLHGCLLRRLHPHVLGALVRHRSRQARPLTTGRRSRRWSS